MPKVTFIEHGGTVHTVNAKSGASLMETAVRNDIGSIAAECGCTCATCHVYVGEAWTERVGPRSPEEDAELNAAFDVRANSRLSCRITVTKALDGLIVRTPYYQER